VSRRLTATLLAAWLAASPALSASPTAGDSALAAARAAERARNYQEAFGIWTELERSDPSGPHALTARTRREELALRRDLDGGFAGLSTLESVRAARAAGLPGSPRPAEGAVAALVESASSSPVLRAEALLWLASEARSRGDHAGALAHTTRAWESRLGLPEALQRRLRIAHARALADLGRVPEAEEVEAGPIATSPGLRPGSPDRQGPAARARARLLHERLGRAGDLGLLVFLALAAPFVPAGLRRPRPAPLGAALLLALLLGSALLLWASQAEALAWLGAFSALALLLHGVSAAALLGSQRVPRREGRWAGRLMPWLAAWATLGAAHAAGRLTESLWIVGGPGPR
jgi:hypothetical protein